MLRSTFPIYQVHKISINCAINNYPSHIWIIALPKPLRWYIQFVGNYCSMLYFFLSHSIVLITLYIPWYDSYSIRICTVFVPITTHARHGIVQNNIYARRTDIKNKKKNVIFRLALTAPTILKQNKEYLMVDIWSSNLAKPALCTLFFPAILLLLFFVCWRCVLRQLFRQSSVYRCLQSTWAGIFIFFSYFLLFSWLLVIS